MLKIIDLRGQTPTTSQLRRNLPRGGTDVAAVLPVVEPVVREVKSRGAAAALEFGTQFDHVTNDTVIVPESAIKQAVQQL